MCRSHVFHNLSATEGEMNDLLDYFPVPLVAGGRARRRLRDIPPGWRGGLKQSRGRLTRACFLLLLSTQEGQRGRSPLCTL